MARLLVFGNEKGGAGKSTLAMHVATGLLHSGAKVGVIDLDLRQITLQRFFENRQHYANTRGISLPTARVGHVTSPQDTHQSGWEKIAFDSAITELGGGVDYIIIDCPGALTPFSALAHAAADTLITPLNDSFIDFDLLARVDADTNKVKGPSIYSEMVWDARKERALAGDKPIDWIVARNRLSATNMHNKRNVGEALTDLSKRIGFRFVAGLSDRVIYRELFPKGLTILDHKLVTEVPRKMSNIAARQEVRDILTELRLDGLKLGI